ncbi:hypothetical protein F53441_9704 [Fusarium austroafricanum]|uniref:Heterokaryon incompatibility domain-containing protein n=1 Tax=Fusarium austroafricanum TaxID=2364996 RepID=A0A8H4KBW8_9HYPO|nr:hypothetical protein F53441_9704 [Fusarium austroafricanum]
MANIVPSEQNCCPPAPPDSEVSSGQTVSNSAPSQEIFATPGNHSFLQRFSYGDLDPLQHQIRLVHAFQKPGSDLIHGNLLPPQKLADISGQYHTISYCAGSAKVTRPIILNGLEFNVFANLDCALRETLAFWRTSDTSEEDCILWIDQICINQHSDSERSHQVGFMRDIYSNSKRTFICLTTADEETLSPHPFPWISQGMEFDKLTSWQYESMSAYLDSWESFYRLIERPWWRRAWIRQEFACSQNAVFLYQYQALDDPANTKLRGFCEVAKFLISRLPDGYRVESLLLQPKEQARLEDLKDACYRAHAHGALEAVISLLNSKDKWNVTFMDLKKLLLSSLQCKASDPRDKVFALLGLAHPGYNIEPNYDSSNTISEVLIDTAKRIILFEGNLDILSYAIRLKRAEMSDLPSWVPDWASPESHRPFIGHSEDYSEEQRNQSKNDILRSVRGLLVDVLKEPGASPFFSFFTYEDSITNNMFEVYCPFGTMEGDEIWLLEGSWGPYLLRPVRGGYGGYRLVGEIQNWTFPNDQGQDDLQDHFDQLLEDLLIQLRYSHVYNNV